MGEKSDDKLPGLTRRRLAEVALDLVQAEGLPALTMRVLADRLGVKAASLYWHVRDRDELVELLAQALLGEVRLPGAGGGWRADAIAVCSELERVVLERRDAGRILLEVPEALERSDAHARLSGVLESAGLRLAQAQEVATMMLVYVLVASARGTGPQAGGLPGSRTASVAVDTGSRGVTLRAGSDVTGLIRVARDPAAAAPAVIRGDTVIVRRRRGAGQSELELNRDHQWHIRVQAPTWNTVLDLEGLDVRGIHIDSGASRIECVLPPPRGSVPINVSGGVVGVRLRRPPGVKVVADISTAAVQVRLDAFTIAAATSDVHWESAGPAASDCYRLKISGGAVRVSIEEDASISPGAVAAEDRSGSAAGTVEVLDLLLEGVARRAGESGRA